MEDFHFESQFLYQLKDKWPQTILSRQQTAYFSAVIMNLASEVSRFFQDIDARTSSWF